MHSRAARAARYAPLVRYGQRRRISATTARVEQHNDASQSQISADDLDALERLTTRTIKAAGEGQTWPGWKQPKQLQEDALWRDTQRPTSVSSEKKDQFMVSQEEEFAMTAPEALYGASEDTYIEPGSIVELRRNNIVTLAVLLRSSVVDMRPLFASFTAQGELYEHDIADAVWVSPDFVPQYIVEQCGTSERPETQAQHSARVHIVRSLRAFERQVERAQSMFASNFPTLYERVRHHDPAEPTEIKTADVAVILLGKRKTPDFVDVFAAHRLLMDHSLYYQCHPRVHRVAQTFLVRPRTDIDNYESVVAWFREPNNTQIVSFVRKSKDILKSSHDKSSLQAPEIISDKGLPNFNEHDKKILLFLRHASTTVRSVQRSMYSVFAMKLLKMVGFFQPGDPIAPRHIFDFLKAIGVLPPWEDVSLTRPHMFALSRGTPGASKGEQRRTVLAMQRPPRNAEVSLNPSSDTFYPRDIMEDMRHDFGDMPVYIIDDPTAKELDDGVSVEQIPGTQDECWLHVHIADPTTLVHPAHELAHYARQIATSVYFRHRTWGMFPDALTINRFSLGAPLRQDWPAGAPMETMTFSARINAAGEILEAKTRAAYIRKPVVITYDSVDHALGPPYGHIEYPFAATSLPAPKPSPLPANAVQDLKLIERLAASLRHQRLKQPIFFWQMPRPEVSLPAEANGGLPLRPYIPNEPAFFRGYPSVSYGVSSSQAGRAQLLVSECMILGGRLASRTATALDVGVLRRVAPPPFVQPEFAKQFQALLARRDPDTGLVDMYEVLQCSVFIHTGSYTLEPGEHGMMGILHGEGYGRATSPLRRYLDLVTHWQLKAGLLRAAGKGHPPLFSDTLLKELAVEQGTRQIENDRAMLDNERFWAVDYIQRLLDASAPPSSSRRFSIAKSTQTRSMRFDSVAVSTPKLNMRTREHFVLTHVPALGLLVRVEGIPRQDSLQLGQNFPIVITHTSMGPPTVFGRPDAGAAGSIVG